MTFLRAIWSDLLEQRLWPVAVLLVVALVAAPVALSRLGGSDSSPPPLPAAPAAQAPPPQATTQLTSTAPSVASPVPSGRYRDPFKGASVDSTATGSNASAPSSAQGHDSSKGAQGSTDTAASPSTGSAGSAAPATSPGPAPTPVVAPAPAPRAVPTGVPAGYRANVTWGQLGDELQLHDVVRLARLQAGASDAAIYMGVREGGKVAVFLLAPGVKATGEGDCYPTVDVCQLVELRKGDTERVAVPQADGRTKHFRLRMDAVAQRRAGTKAAARRLRRRESRSGRRALYGIIRSGRTYVSEFMYSGARGILFKHEKGRASHSAATASVPAASVPVAAPASLPPAQ